MICDGGINGNPVGHYSIVPTDPTMTAAEVTSQVLKLGWEKPANGVVVTKNRELKWL